MTSRVRRTLPLAAWWWLIVVASVAVGALLGATWMLRAAQQAGQPVEAMWSQAWQFASHTALILGLLALAALTALGLALHRLARPWRELIAQLHQAPEADLGPAHQHTTRIQEVAALAEALQRQRTDQLRVRLLAQAMAGESSLEPLYQLLLTDVEPVLHAEAAAVFAPAPDDAQRLQVMAVRSNFSVQPEGVPPIALKLPSDHPVAQMLRSRENVGPAPDPHSVFPDLPDSRHGRGQWIVLPLRLPDDRLAAVVVAWVSHSDPVEPRTLALAYALCEVGTQAIHHTLAMSEQRQLISGLAQLIATAIDSRSPVPDAHGRRVPELARMLAIAACDRQEGPLADFQLSDTDWESLNLAAWLHDVGKITVPGHVIDKGTKLHTLYNRIHEIRMRFEVLKRDAEIQSLKQRLGGRDDVEALQDLGTALSTLDDEFHFVARCNQGDVPLTEADSARLRRIAMRTWQRTLSDREGLSRAEQERHQFSAPTTLPATEALLADKPEHAIRRLNPERVAEDNAWGFKVRTPALRFNLGELHNLSVPRGALTTEERYLINEHIMQTITMLGGLRFPYHLRDVPDLAAGHHEAMDGTGYPRALQGDELSIPVRILAIADLFESLTAEHRPYRLPHTLSEALTILQALRDAGKIDADLFDLLIESKVYLAYAKRFMAPSQIDALPDSFFQPRSAPQTAQRLRELDDDIAAGPHRLRSPSAH